MTPEDARLQFRQWLIEHELEPEVAYAILESVPPFDWSQIARRDEMNERFDAADRRFDRLEQRLDGMDQRFTGVGQRLDGMDQRFDGLNDAFEVLRLSMESQLVALEGRLSMRWMETTRIIVFALITLFLGIAGISIGLAQG